MNRRRFLKNSALAGGLLAFPNISRLSAQKRDSDLLRVACIGVGGHGKWAARSAAKEIAVGFCDVDEQRAAGTYSDFPDVPRFRDFRKLFDTYGDQIDAVNIATPDHTHYPIAMEALQRGYHVYLEKPMAHSIAEIRNLQRAAVKYQRITQLGVQGHSASGLRVLKEWLDAGVIGEVVDIHFWTDRPKERDFHNFEKDAPAQGVPDHLDWDLWLGPARERPYNSVYLPTSWRGWWDFGNGPLGDIGAHMWDVIEFCLQLGPPSVVSGQNPRDSVIGTPRWCKVDYLYDRRPNGKSPLSVHWYSGVRDGEPHLPLNLPYWPKLKPLKTEAGMYLVGTEGAIYYPGMRAEMAPTVLPEQRWLDFRQNLPPQSLPRIKGGHHAEFFNAIREGREANASFAYGGPLNEGVLVGNLALRTGKTIYWDAENMQALNVPEADRYIHSPEPRKGWSYSI